MRNATTAIFVSLLMVLAPLSGAVALGAPTGSTDAPSGSTDHAAKTDGSPGSEHRRPTVDRTNSGNETNESRGHPKVEDGLLDGALQAGATAPDRTAVVVEARPGSGDRAARTARRLGTIEVHHENRIQVTLPRVAIPTLADSPAVAYVRAPIPVEPVGDVAVEPDEPGPSTPYRSAPTTSLELGTGVGTARTVGSASVAGSVTSEGVAVIGADEAHHAGYDGEEVTVAVVDTGFDTDEEEIADRIVRTKDFSGTGVDGDRTAHGTATAEIVVDVAPNVDLILVKATSATEMLAAIDWVDTETDADVASMSLGIQGGMPLDGTSKLDRELDDSVANGTLWAVSAGNEGAGKHWNGTFRDGDEDGFHNFTGHDETMAVEGPLSARLQWDDWPRTDQNYDLLVLDGDGNVVASSQTVQDGNQSPYESVFCSCSGTHYVVVERVDANGGADFDMFMTTGSTPEYIAAERSLTVPATAERATTVGAVRYDTEELEPYSSRGPTKDGRRKPDVVAPTAVSTASYPDQEFAGTSASAPHVAGSAALVIDGDESLSSAEVERRLRTTARPVRGTEPNPRTGEGLVDVSAALLPMEPAETTVATDPIGSGDAGSVPVDVGFPSQPDGGEVVVQLRDEAGNTASGRAGADTDSETTRVRVDASNLNDGEVVARAKFVDARGNENPDGFTAASDPVAKDSKRPTIGGFELTDRGNGTLEVRLVTSERLSRIAVDLANGSGSVLETLEEDDFGRSDENYSARLEVAEPGSYTATLRVATDDAGNDGSSGEVGSIEVDDVDGGSTVDDGDAGDDPSPRSIRVDLSAAEKRIAPGESTAVTVALNRTQRGLRAYQLSLLVEDGGEITDVSPVDGQGLVDVNVSTDGSIAQIKAINDGIEGNETDVAFLTVTVTGSSPGTTNVSADVETLTNQRIETYSVVGVDGATIQVDGDATAGVDVTGDGRRSSDLDGDGRHEDVDGDGEVTVVDVQVLFTALVEAAPSRLEDPLLFDYNGDGNVTIVDVQSLFAKYVAN